MNGIINVFEANGFEPEIRRPGKKADARVTECGLGSMACPMRRNAQYIHSQIGAVVEFALRFTILNGDCGLGVHVGDEFDASGDFSAEVERDCRRIFFSWRDAAQSYR